jgi:hypothetical protein
MKKKQKSKISRYCPFKGLSPQIETVRKLLLNIFFQRLFKRSCSYEFFSQNACKPLVALPSVAHGKFAWVYMVAHRKVIILSIRGVQIVRG